MKTNVFYYHENIVIAGKIKGKYKDYMIVKLAFAFGAGFISFLTPCVLTHNSRLYFLYYWKKLE